jgi:hypothetical protein
MNCSQLMVMHPATNNKAEYTDIPGMSLTSKQFSIHNPSQDEDVCSKQNKSRDDRDCQRQQ